MFWCTFIYVDSDRQHPKDFWAELQLLASDINGLWIVGGDFNATLHPTDSNQVGNTSCCSFFSNWIHMNVMQEIKSLGTRYTWRCGSLYKTLDRYIGNMQWMSAFPQSISIYLPRLSLDNNGILLRISVQQFKKEREFKYMVVWEGNRDFKSVVGHSWNSNEYLHAGIQTLR